MKWESNVNPINVFLDFQKWEFVEWNKEKQVQVIHKLDNFAVVDVWYTVKWKTYNKEQNTFTEYFHSNEIKTWDEPMYIVRTMFLNKQPMQDLICKWYWKQDVKHKLGSKAYLHIAITILDLNDWMIKEIFLSWNNFFKASNFLKEIDTDSILEIDTKVVYENTSNKKIITEKEMDELRWAEASKYSARYIAELVDTWKKINEEQREFINETFSAIWEYMISNREYYKNKYWETENKKEYAKIEDNDNNVQKPKQVQKENIINPIEQIWDDISIEDVPF